MTEQRTGLAAEVPTFDQWITGGHYTKTPVIASPFADPEADAKGYPHREVPRCRERTPSQSGCRIACIGGVCVYLRHENCPWPNWGNLTHKERDDYNDVPLAHRAHKQDTEPNKEN